MPRRGGSGPAPSADAPRGRCRPRCSAFRKTNSRPRVRDAIMTLMHEVDRLRARGRAGRAQAGGHGAHAPTRTCCCRSSTAAPSCARSRASSSFAERYKHAIKPRSISTSRFQGGERRPWPCRRRRRAASCRRSDPRPDPRHRCRGAARRRRVRRDPGPCRRASRRSSKGASLAQALRDASARSATASPCRCHFPMASTNCAPAKRRTPPCAQADRAMYAQKRARALSSCVTQ